MICNCCTECNNIIPQGCPWVFGKDYLFCSSNCRYKFLNDNPNLENKCTISKRVPEETQPIYIPKVSSLLVIHINNTEEPPKENISSKNRQILNYILCNFYRKYLFS